MLCQEYLLAGPLGERLSSGSYSICRVTGVVEPCVARRGSEERRGGACAQSRAEHQRSLLGAALAQRWRRVCSGGPRRGDQGGKRWPGGSGRGGLPGRGMRGRLPCVRQHPHRHVQLPGRRRFQSARAELPAGQEEGALILPSFKDGNVLKGPLLLNAIAASHAMTFTNGWQLLNHLLKRHSSIYC
jgi:hypothetical protein